MKKNLTDAKALLLLCSTVSYGQTSTAVRGVLKDTIEHNSMENSVISVMRARDSVLLKHTRAAKDGSFKLSGISSDSVLIMITHPYSGDFFDWLLLKSGETYDLGNVFMIPKSKLLEEVIVKTGAPIRLKGDTTVYTADSFKVKEGANVQELLRKLPSIQVDRDGTITAMGEKVTKMLVDGEEFFGTDPGMASKNLRADMVKEVEVFDKKSDQAEFTGIDDGVRDKTINLKLKEDKKNGYFGKAELAGGLKDKFNNALMYNNFKGKRKFAAYGLMGNTGRTDLDWQDAMNYGGGGMESGISEDGGMFISMSGGNEFFGGANGIPTNWSAAAHYNNKINDKHSYNTSYRFSKINAPGEDRNFTKNFLQDTTWYTNSTNRFKNSMIRQALTLTMDFQIDSMNSIKWTTTGNTNRTTGFADYYSESLSEAGDSINNSRSITNYVNDNKAINSSILWRHKFRKVGRTLSVNSTLNWTKSDGNNLQDAKYAYYDKGLFQRGDTINQQYFTNAENQSLATRFAYTEPLAKDLFMELSYALNYFGNKNDRTTYFADEHGGYTEKIDSLSNDFVFNRLENRPGVNFRWNKKKYNVSAGASVGFSDFTQKDLTKQTNTSYSFVNFFPQASATYKFKSSTSLRMNYNGATSAPSLEQLQPVRINTDINNIYIGNPDLKQSFRHSLNFNYNNYNTLSGTSMYASLNVSTTQNAFTQYSTYLEAGKRTYQTVNVDGIYNANLYTDYGFKMPESNWRFGFGPTANYSQNVNYINRNNETQENKNRSYGYGMSVSVSHSVENKFDFYFSPNFNWNSTKSSINPEANAKYWSLGGWANLNIQLPLKFELSADANAQMRQKDERFPANNNFIIMNTYLGKKILKNEFEFRFNVFDVFNQNRGYTRSFNSQMFTENYRTTLQRFWTVSAIWNFNKKGTARPASFF